MGYVNGEFYEKFVGHTSGCSNKISDLQRATNKIDLNEYKELIDRVQKQFEKDMKDPSNVHFNAGNYDISNTQLRQTEHSIHKTKDEDENER